MYDWKSDFDPHTLSGLISHFSLETESSPGLKGVTRGQDRYSPRYRTGTVRVTVVRTVAVLRAGVPAAALGHLLGWLAGLAVRSEHVALATAKLVWLLVIKRRDKDSALTCSDLLTLNNEKLSYKVARPPDL